MNGTDNAPDDMRQEKLEEQLDRAQKEAAENWDRFLRAQAELENLRRRTRRDIEQGIFLGKRDLLLALLDVLDNLDRALAAARQPGGTVESLLAGIEMIGRQFLAVLEAEGIEPIAALNQPFDPAIHEAVASWETPDVAEDTVTDEIRKGYMYRGEILRPARVRVGRPVAGGEESGEADG